MRRFWNLLAVAFLTVSLGGCAVGAGMIGGPIADRNKKPIFVTVETNSAVSISLQQQIVAEVSGELKSRGFDVSTTEVSRPVVVTLRVNQNGSTVQVASVVHRYGFLVKDVGSAMGDLANVSHQISDKLALYLGG